MSAAEGVRDVFGRILAIVELTYTMSLAIPSQKCLFLLPIVMAFPSRRTRQLSQKPLKVNKKLFLHANSSITPIEATVIDGGIMLHETVMKHSKSTYAMMARDLLVKICSYCGEQVHLVLHKYQSPSIKDAERNLRYSSTPQAFNITGPDQAQRQSGTELLKNVIFKEAFAIFLMEEWKKPQYGPILGGKTVYISHGGTCIEDE